MKRLIIVCEGPTEQEFSQDVLAPALLKYDIQVEAPTIHHSNGGIVPWHTLKRQILSHLREGDAKVTLLVDFYGIKDDFGFPSWEEAKAIVDKAERMHFLFAKMAEDIPDNVRYRFIPYIQLHEFEGLLFSDVNAFLQSFDEEKIAFADIQAAANAFDNPELINNSPVTAPSKRLIAAIPNYSKVIYGNCIAMDIGIDKIREKCPLFNEWVGKLESI